MKILVPIKRVADPDNANKVKVAPDGSSVTSEGLEWKLNPFDEWSLEAALRLTENAADKSRVGEVVLVSIGPSDATQTIRQGLAMGAERARSLLMFFWWASRVPPPISMSLASRHRRSTGYSRQ